jgi:chaperone required for assembly of F1-ATPase
MLRPEQEKHTVRPVDESDQVEKREHRYKPVIDLAQNASRLRLIQLDALRLDPTRRKGVFLRIDVLNALLVVQHHAILHVQSCSRHVGIAGVM